MPSGDPGPQFSAGPSTVIEDALGVVEGTFDLSDPVSIGRSFVVAMARAARHPMKSSPAWFRFATSLGVVGVDTAARAVGVHLPGVSRAEAKDSRFTAPAFNDNFMYHGLLEAYVALARLIRELVHAGRLDDATSAKADFAAQLVADALAPTNFLLTNPSAIERVFQTAGLSLVRGARNFAHDVRHNDGWPSQVDREAFVLGENTATTPGKVVFRNELIELLQFTPQTETVHAIPLLVCPPWINRYYIADLAPGRSLVEWAVRGGHSTFAISYRNPDSSMRDLTFDDYLRLGPLTAIDVVREITGSEKVNTVAICLGGTMNVMALAYLDACGDDVVNSATYLNSAVDYRDAGRLSSVFADSGTADNLAARIEEQGYLEGKEMARTFDLLRANDLIFRYVANNWLHGNSPPKFDLLAWNADATNLPGKAHAHFLRELYLNNSLANDEFVAMGERLMVSEITTDTYLVAAIEDHIVPWRVSYRSTQIFKGPVRFVLTSSGHIAGIVNPPGPRPRLWTNEHLPPDADDWLAAASQHQDTWWNDWIGWVSARAGDRVAPPPMGTDAHPVLGDAPGTYVTS
ncbi:MAG: alpha/beta fold hydrolase [Acidimicrobiia bacterium]